MNKFVFNTFIYCLTVTNHVKFLVQYNNTVRIEISLTLFTLNIIYLDILSIKDLC